MEAYERVAPGHRPGGIVTSQATRAVHLPADLCEAAEAQFATEFSTLEELLVFVLKELVRDDSRKLDQNDQRVIEARLRDLGYL